MTAFRLAINVDGFNQARLAPAIQADLHARGVRVAQAAGGQEDFEVIDAPSRTRSRVIVRTATPKARRAEATTRALTRAFDAARG